jgi:hypothetical protein
MALTRANTTLIQWSAADSVTVNDGTTYFTSDAQLFNDTTVAASLSVDANNAGTPQSGDTVDIFVSWTGGNVDGSAGDDYDTSLHALYLGRLDTNSQDPARKTWSLDVGAKGLKVMALGNSNAGTRNIVVRAALHEVRS